MQNSGSVAGMEAGRALSGLNGIEYCITLVAITRIAESTGVMLSGWYLSARAISAAVPLPSLWQDLRV